MSKKDYRMKIIGEHSDYLRKKMENIKVSKTHAQKIKKESENICVNLDKNEENTYKELRLYEMVTPEVVEQISDGSWADFERLHQSTAFFPDPLDSFSKDLEDFSKNTMFLDTTSGTLLQSGFTGAASAFNVFSDSEIKDKSFIVNVTTLRVEHATSDHIEFIKTELYAIIPDLVGDFERVVRGFSSESEPGLKYGALISLRSVIFDQLFERLAHESYFMRTNWFQSSSKKKRHCQPKYFMIGFTEETDIPSSALYEVNITTVRLENLFKDLSNYGKNGGPEVAVTNVYNETLSSLTSAFKLRKSSFKAAP